MLLLSIAFLSIPQLSVKNLKVAAMKDDAVTSKQEEKVLKKLNKITDKYIDELENLLD